MNQVQIKISVSEQLNDLLQSKASRLGLPITQFVKHLVIKEVEQEDLIFEEFVPKPLSEIRKEFEKTGKYNKKFIDSLMRGLKDSSFYEGKTS